MNYRSFPSITGVFVATALVGLSFGHATAQTTCEFHSLMRLCRHYCAQSQTLVRPYFYLQAQLRSTIALDDI